MATSVGSAALRLHFLRASPMWKSTSASTSARCVRNTPLPDKRPLFSMSMTNGESSRSRRVLSDAIWTLPRAMRSDGDRAISTCCSVATPSCVTQQSMALSLQSWYVRIASPPVPHPRPHEFWTMNPAGV